MIRKIIRIDEEKCNGCGLCAKACHEGAIGMVNGKAKLLRDDYCDGLGDCLPACPTGASAAPQRSCTAGCWTLCSPVPFPVSWTVKMKKKQKETQDILSYHTQAAGCSDKARAKASGGRQPIEECGRTGL